jgi:hypothetical protein
MNTHRIVSSRGSSQRGMILKHLATFAYHDFVEEDGFQVGLAIVV